MSIGTSIRASATYERWGAVSAKQAALIGVPATLGIAALATGYPIEVLGLLGALILVALVLLQPAVGLVSLFALEPFWGAFYPYFHEVRGLHFGPLTLGKDALIV